MYGQWIGAYEGTNLEFQQTWDSVRHLYPPGGHFPSVRGLLAQCCYIRDAIPVSRMTIDLDNFTSDFTGRSESTDALRIFPNPIDDHCITITIRPCGTLSCIPFF